MKFILKQIRVYFLFACMFLAKDAFSQAFEIRLNDKGLGVISVEMRETTGVSPKTTDFITDITFGIKWMGANLDLSNVITSSYNMKKSGTRLEKDNFYFQAFYSDPIGFNPPANWQQNVWVEIMSLALSGTGTAIFQLAEKNFDATTDPNFGLNFIDYTPVIVGTPIVTPLPVNLTNFDITPVNRMIKLQWRTEPELNSMGFEIQRSDGDATEFKKIQWINSKTNTIGNVYAYLDKDVITKRKYYYRLKQIDSDDRFKYSEIKTAYLEESDKHTVNIFPNPTHDFLQILLNNALQRGRVTLKVVDTKGAVILTSSHFIDVNSNIRLNLKGLVNGQYLLVVEQNNGMIDTKPFQKN